jgi:hypothetical protein
MAFYSDIHATKKFRLGTEKTDVDGKVYIYLKGVASTAAGSWVTFDENFATTLLAANAVGPVAISMAANTSATNYSWYQVKGINAIASTDTVAADKALYIDGTAGRADDAVVSGDLIVGAASMAADSSNVCTVMLNRPFVTDVLG